MKSRLNDTAALKAMPSKADTKGCTYESVSVRPIDNGFIVSKTCDLDGRYESSECYVPERPQLLTESNQSSQSSSMKDAVKSLKD